jgi:phosphatidylserine/phosphatidylglycerophosphate/cardiolipin synthase-like enzyme
MPFIQGSIEIYCGPSDIGAPDDLEAAIIAFINGARATLDIAVQELESYNIARAIVSARQRGVRIRMVIEQDYLRSYPAAPEPFVIDPTISLHENRQIMAALLRASIDVRADYNPKIFHQKFIIRDLNETTRAILTGSTNFTPTGVGTHPFRKNLNHIVIIHNKWVANEYQQEFDEIWNGTFGTRRKRHEDTPRNSRVSGIRVRAIFGPDHTPELEMMKQILKARQRVDFAIFTFSQSSGIDDVMIARAGGELAIRGAFDRMQGNQVWASSHGLAAAGVEIFFTNRGQSLGKLHHKLMVIDDRLIISGSFNYTGPANRLNDENILVIGDLEEDDPANDLAQTTLATAVRQEIDRIISVHCG